MDFSGKVAIVTGCASGIGLATTEILLSSNAKVFGLDVNTALLEHPNFVYYKCDITSNESISAAVAVCVQKHGAKIDVLANVAGVMDGFASADTVTDAEWDRQFSINLVAPMLLTRAVLRYMIPHDSGAIVNVASRAALGGGAAGVAYTAAKTGLIGLTKNVAWRFHNQGIRCNAVCPGNTQSNIRESIRPDVYDEVAFEVAKPLIALHSPSEGFQSVLQASDVANVVVFLASGMAGKVSGAVVPVDNGWSAA